MHRVRWLLLWWWLRYRGLVDLLGGEKKRREKWRNGDGGCGVKKGFLIVRSVFAIEALSKVSSLCGKKRV